MIGRALDGEVQGNFQVDGARGQDEPIEIVDRPDRRLDGGVSAMFVANRPGAAGIVGRGVEGVVRAFPVRAADRMDGGEVHHIETHLADIRQAALGVAKRARGAGRRTLRPDE